MFCPKCSKEDATEYSGIAKDHDKNDFCVWVCWVCNIQFWVEYK